MIQFKFLGVQHQEKNNNEKHSGSNILAMSVPLIKWLFIRLCSQMRTIGNTSSYPFFPPFCTCFLMINVQRVDAKRKGVQSK